MEDAPVKRAQSEIIGLLEALDDWSEYRTPAATPEHLSLFVGEATRRGVPDDVIEQLSDLYAVCDCCSYETVMSFHNCSNTILFEWWRNEELWLGQRDFYTLRWSGSLGKFSLGDPSNISFGPDYESSTLIGLVEICVKEIKSDAADAEVNS